VSFVDKSADEARDKEPTHLRHATGMAAQLPPPSTRALVA
jgi:hypothetical protein